VAQVIECLSVLQMQGLEFKTPVLLKAKKKVSLKFLEFNKFAMSTDKIYFHA
jgi:hypothetical protein